MFGPDYELGACPGCSNLGDELGATRVHQIPEVNGMIDNPPEWLEDWGRSLEPSSTTACVRAPAS
jgi:hypothetical protein